MSELRNLVLDRVDLCGTPANPECHVTLFKSARALPSTRQDPGGVPMATKPTEAEALEALRKELDDLKAERAAAADALAKAKADAEAEIAKAAEAAKPIAEQLEVVKAESAKNAEALAKAVADLAKAEHERQLAHYTDVAKSDFAALGAASELGPMLMAIAAAVTPETQATLERVLKAANAQLSSAAHMRQVTAGVTGETNDALGKIRKAAQALVDAGTVPTIEQATARVVKDHPDLAAEYAAAMSA